MGFNWKEDQLRVLYSVLAAAVSAFSLVALLAMTVPAPSSEGRLTAELGPVTVISAETPPALATRNDVVEMKNEDLAEMKSGNC